MSPLNTAIIVVFAYNLLVGLVYAADKWMAIKGRSRVRERTLLLLAAAFGSPGALAAMRLCRHKTRKPKFSVGVPLLLLMQLGGLGALWWKLAP